MPRWIAVMLDPPHGELDQGFGGAEAEGERGDPAEAKRLASPAARGFPATAVRKSSRSSA
jgi:hypothetical protein